MNRHTLSIPVPVLRAFAGPGPDVYIRTLRSGNHPGYMGMAGDDSFIRLSENLFAGESKLIVRVTKYSPCPEIELSVNVPRGPLLPEAAMNAGLRLKDSVVVHPERNESSIRPGIIIFEGEIETSPCEALPKRVKVRFELCAIERRISH